VHESATTAQFDIRAAALRPRGPVAFLRAWSPFLACIALAMFLQLAVKPLVAEHLNQFYAKLLLDIGTNIILAVSLTMVNGFTGQFSIGHAAFMAVGAYTAAGIVYYGSYRIWGEATLNAGVLSTMTGSGEGLLAKGDLLFLASLLAGGLVAALCGYVVGLPSLRLKGDYLAIVTLGFGEIVRVLIQQTGDVMYDAEEIARTPLWKLPTSVGGALGFAGLPSYASLFWAWLVAAITLLVAYRLKVSSYGRAFLSIREDEVAAEAMGVNTTRYKVWAFVLAAFFAGIAGGIYAHTLGVQLTPNELGFQKSFDIIIMVVLGGMGSISGAAIAAAILTVLPELLRNPPPLVPWGSWLAIPLFLAILWGIIAPRGRKLDGTAIGFAGSALAGVLVLIGHGLAQWWARPPLLPDSLSVAWACVWIAGLIGISLLVRGRVFRRFPAVLLLGAVLAAWELARWLAPQAGVNLADYRMVLYALALILMMILRPQGLLGLRELWDLWRGGRGAKRIEDEHETAAAGESGRAGRGAVS
jgi:branched-chain amino acid transport system permease protein